MKNVTFLFVVIACAGNAFCQSPEMEKTKESYLEKSKTNKSVGWVLVAGGSTMIVAGLIADANSTGLDFTGAAIAVIGTGVALTSIPFFIVSGSQARRAAEIGLTRQEVVFLGHGRITTTPQLAISIRVRLK